MRMSEQAKQNKRIYMKKWRAANQDKIKEHQNRYWSKRLEQEKESK